MNWVPNADVVPSHITLTDTNILRSQQLPARLGEQKANGKWILPAGGTDIVV